MPVNATSDTTALNAPIARQAVVEPYTPVDVEGLAGVAVDQGADHVHRGQHREDAQEAPERV